MEQAGSYLFVYGTLLDQRNEFAVYLKRNCSFYGDGKFKGKLYDTGEYPAAIFLPESTNYVYGKIFLMNKPATLLKQLDDYEGYGSNQTQTNLFIREQIAIETAKRLMICWVYLYNLPVTGLKLIASGDYSLYLNTHKTKTE
jgi:gamma-glutamylcyclotransferase (GGCT)/AIG2-like uncharacterized protein YtfP